MKCLAELCHSQSHAKNQSCPMATRTAGHSVSSTETCKRKCFVTTRPLLWWFLIETWAAEARSMCPPSTHPPLHSIQAEHLSTPFMPLRYSQMWLITIVQKLQTPWFDLNHGGHLAAQTPINRKLSKTEEHLHPLSHLLSPLVGVFEADFFLWRFLSLFWFQARVVYILFFSLWPSQTSLFPNHAHMSSEPCLL